MPIWMNCCRKLTSVKDRISFKIMTSVKLLCTNRLLFSINYYYLQNHLIRATFGTFSFPSPVTHTQKSFAFRSCNPGLGIRNPKTKTVCKIFNFYLKRILAANKIKLYCILTEWLHTYMNILPSVVLRLESTNHWINHFIPCHRKCSQSECSKADVYPSVFHPTFPSTIAIQLYHTQPSHRVLRFPPVSFNFCLSQIFFTPLQFWGKKTISNLVMNNL